MQHGTKQGAEYTGVGQMVSDRTNRWQGCCMDRLVLSVALWVEVQLGYESTCSETLIDTKQTSQN